MHHPDTPARLGGRRRSNVAFFWQIGADGGPFPAILGEENDGRAESCGLW